MSAVDKTGVHGQSELTVVIGAAAHPAFPREPFSPRTARIPQQPCSPRLPRCSPWGPRGPQQPVPPPATHREMAREVNLSDYSWVEALPSWGNAVAPVSRGRRLELDYGL